MVGCYSPGAQDAAGFAESDEDASGSEERSASDEEAKAGQATASMDAAQCALPATACLRRAAGAAPVALPTEAMSAHLAGWLHLVEGCSGLSEVFSLLLS